MSCNVGWGFPLVFPVSSYWDRDLWWASTTQKVFHKTGALFNAKAQVEDVAENLTELVVGGGEHRGEGGGGGWEAPEMVEVLMLGWGCACRGSWRWACLLAQPLSPSSGFLPFMFTLLGDPSKPPLCCYCDAGSPPFPSWRWPYTLWSLILDPSAPSSAHLCHLTGKPSFPPAARFSVQESLRAWCLRTTRPS